MSGIGPLMDSAKTLVTCPTQMAEMLSTQYTSVFSEPKEEMEDPEVLIPGWKLFRILDPQCSLWSGRHCQCHK